MLVRRLSGPFDERSVDLARTLVDQAATALALVRAARRGRNGRVAGCMNHRAMRRRLEEEIGRATRAGSPLSCILIDLDDFKLVNDRHGHQAGDAVFARGRAGRSWASSAPSIASRATAGDEFVVILPNADLRDAASRRHPRARAHARRLGARQRDGISASIGPSRSGTRR